ncbi:MULTISPECIES: ABC transporter ATP-binding protein [Calditerrivibrio]|jgi:ABC-2 type transport system ATP-binding protein|uniref:ABC transporter ATP-binding protein n=1 Tax=Calditerrivibrio TaxID=545865 RepID=UPI003C715EFF
MNVIEVDRLFKTFKSKYIKVAALNGMSFSVKQGEIYGFLGPNGAGKSTTIKIIMDLIRADTGEVRIMGLPSTDYKARINIGFMPENPQYYDNITGLDLLMLSAFMFKLKRDIAYKKALNLLETFGLIDSAKKQLRKYSKGMIQKIGFASAIIHDPKILILDEPMSGLDPIGRVLFKNIMNELNKNGTTIFFSSHIIPDIEEICSKVIIVKSGQVVNELDRLQIKHLTTSGFQIIFKKRNILIPNYKIDALNDDLMQVEVNKNDFFYVMEILKNSSVEIIDIVSIKHSLEDIFIDMV